MYMMRVHGKLLCIVSYNKRDHISKNLAMVKISEDIYFLCSQESSVNLEFSNRLLKYIHGYFAFSITDIPHLRSYQEDCLKLKEFIFFIRLELNFMSRWMIDINVLEQYETEEENTTPNERHIEMESFSRKTLWLQVQPMLHNRKQCT